jgi:LysM repeat protein
LRVQETNRQVGQGRPVAGIALALVVALLVALPVPVDAASLTPSRPGLMRQVRAAQSHGAYYARNEGDLRSMQHNGELVRIDGNDDFVLKYSVPFPYARPEVELFLERLGEQYRAACGKRLVVTSLIRPKNRQPRNSSPLSVHPTGMAMDLRISSSPACRSWVERALLNLESAGVLEAARERYPPHYHVVLFPDPYVGYVEKKEGRTVTAKYEYEAQPEAETGDVVSYRVRGGDSLWAIARRYDTTAQSIQRANGLRSTVLRPGQVLRIPVGMEATMSRHTVRSGDTLSSIARRYGSTSLAIQQVNGLASSTIRPGQTLKVPQVDSRGYTEEGPVAVTATYRVRRGDSLWTIARRHGTSTSSIQRANGLRSSRIKPGQVLKIPSTR